MRFKRIYIEITNTCNLQCSFCIQNVRPAHNMKIEEFRHVIREIEPYCEYVYLHVMGEPLSHPELDTFLSILDTTKVKVTITTNGTLLKEMKQVLLQHDIRQINVSLHSFPQHIREDYFQDVFESCESLAKQGMMINYRLWSLSNQKLSIETEAILVRLQERYKQDIQKTDIYRMQRIQLKEKISLHFEMQFEWPSLQHPYVGEHGRCLGMKQMCGILSDGSVVPCCLDSKGDCTLGNIFETSFFDILQSARANKIVTAFSQQKVVEELCQHCSYRLRFYDPGK